MERTQAGSVPFLHEYFPSFRSHTKYGDLANFAPDSLRTLEHAVATSLSETLSQRNLFEGFVRGAGLEI